MAVRIEAKPLWNLYSELYPRICSSTERIIFLRGWKMGTKQSLMQECSAALQFPPRGAEDWDSFWEDFVSLEWLSIKSKTLVISDSEKVLNHADPKDKKIFFRMLIDAPVEHAMEWLTRGNQEGELEIILQCEEAHKQTVEAFLEEAKASIRR